MMEVVWLLVGLLVGLSLGFFIWRNANRSSVAKLEEREQQLQDQLGKSESQHQAIQSKLEQLQTANAKIQAEKDHLNTRLSEERDRQEDLQKQFKAEFENLANKILEEKSKKFTDLNRENIKSLLGPLGEKIQSFEKKVEDTDKQTIQRNAQLAEQLKQLRELNQQMSEDAQNLTNALKGDTKKQGNWGELILERVLEMSGLQKGREYIVQDSQVNEQGQRRQPDVVVLLPDNKKIVIDSKVSLVAYEKWVNAEAEEKEQFQKEHVLSIRAHIKNLHSKDYPGLYGIDSCEFVLLFIPIEPAFGAAIEHHPELYNEAFDKGIIIVSTSTLLATLKTINSIWKQEYQNRNVLDIAEEAGKMYDKFVGFMDDLLKVGKSMEDTKKAYDGAMNKLVDGKGNLVRRADNVKKLGAKAVKSLPENLVKRAQEPTDLFDNES